VVPAGAKSSFTLVKSSAKRASSRPSCGSAGRSLAESTGASAAVMTWPCSRTLRSSTAFSASSALRNWS
jgi:hypothetical protein